nr:polymer-forming cytoskeletal protein [Alphaproteobacteria bacterium]
GKKVLIGQEGSVVGTVTAETVEIHGGLKGAVRATSVTLQPTAQVEGDIHHGTLAIAEGAIFDGSVRRPKDPSELTPNLDPTSHQNGKSGAASSYSNS